MSAVLVRELVRRYADRADGTPAVALDGLSLEVEAGEVHGLLGPNGAGKTSLCRILSTILLPTSGTAEILGNDVVTQADRVKRDIGLVFGGDRGLYGRLTARQNLTFWGGLYGLGGARLRRRVDELLDRTGLGERAHERVDKFSRGMKQRLHLARGLIADPPVLLLDEPTVGLDPVAAHDFRALLGELRSAGRSVLLTTHDMAEAAAVCDRVSLIDRGRVLLTERPEAVGRLVSRYERVDAAVVDAPLQDALRAVPGVVSVTELSPGRARVETRDTAATRLVLARLVAHDVAEISTGHPSLEEVYLHVMGSRGMRIGR